MSVLVNDPELAHRLKAEREQTGADRFDEVWEGVYVMAPLANDEHQGLQLAIGAIFQEVVGWNGQGWVRAGVNVSDRDIDWKQNYRCPDVVVFFKGTAAQNRGTHWVGGPDVAVEIVSPFDSARDKLAFYAKVGVRELLVLDRDPWAIEFYELRGGQLVLVTRISPDASTRLESKLLPLTFQFTPASAARPQIEVAHRETGKRWTL